MICNPASSVGWVKSKDCSRSAVSEIPPTATSARLSVTAAFYQYWINVEDASVGTLLRVLTDLDGTTIADLEQQTVDQPYLRAGQRTLAREVTTLVHGAATTDQVEAASQVLFGKGDPATVDPGTLADATHELPDASVPIGTPLVDALVATGLADSKGAARRLLGEGGVSVNNVKVADADRVLAEEDFLHGTVALIRRGRRNLAAVRNGS